MKTHTFLKTALVVGLLAISGASFAASSTVTTTFTGTVLGSCSVTQSTAGVLALRTTDGKVIGTETLGGVNGTFVLTCTGTANMSIAAPVPNAGSIALVYPQPAVAASYLYSANGTWLAGGGGTATSQPSGTYQVGLVYSVGARGANPLPVGDYSSSVTTTITPN
jgi:spore coat protein U-like protein